MPMWNRSTQTSRIPSAANGAGPSRPRRRSATSRSASPASVTQLMIEASWITLAAGPHGSAQARPPVLGSTTAPGGVAKPQATLNAVRTPSRLVEAAVERVYERAHEDQGPAREHEAPPLLSPAAPDQVVHPPAGEHGQRQHEKRREAAVVPAREHRKPGHHLQERRDPEEHAEPHEPEGGHSDPLQRRADDQGGGREHQRERPDVHRAVEHEELHRGGRGTTPEIGHEDAQRELPEHGLQVHRVALAGTDVGRVPEQLREGDHHERHECHPGHHGSAEREHGAREAPDALPAVARGPAPAGARGRRRWPPSRGSSTRDGRSGTPPPAPPPARRPRAGPAVSPTGRSSAAATASTTTRSCGDRTAR